MKNTTSAVRVYLKYLREYYSRIEILTPQVKNFLETMTQWIINEVWLVKPHGSWVTAINIEIWEIVNFDFFRHKNIPVFDNFKFHQFLDSKFEQSSDLKTEFSGNAENRQKEYWECLKELLNSNIIKINNWIGNWYYLSRK